VAILQEKEIRGFQLKNKALVCPVCASDEEKAAPGTELIAEDAVHDPDPMYCTRCKKKIA
jgi:hypothetical protein